MRYEVGGEGVEMRGKGGLLGGFCLGGWEFAGLGSWTRKGNGRYGLQYWCLDIVMCDV